MINIFAAIHHRPYREGDYLDKSSFITSINFFRAPYEASPRPRAPAQDEKVVGAENYLYLKKIHYDPSREDRYSAKTLTITSENFFWQTP